MRYTAWCVASSTTFQSETGKTAQNSLEQNCFGWERPGNGNRVLAPSCLVTMDFSERDPDIDVDRFSGWLSNARLLVQLYLIEDPSSEFSAEWDKWDHTADRMATIMDEATDGSGHTIDDVNWRLDSWGLLEPLTRNIRGDKYKFVDESDNEVKAVVGTFVTQWSG